MGRVREEKGSSEKIRAEKSEKKEEAGARKGRSVAIHSVFPMICGSGWSVGSLKRRVRSQLAGWKMKNYAPFWQEAHSYVEKLKTPHVRTTFGS